MAFDFKSVLTTDQLKGVLNQQIQQFAVQGYQHELNKLIIEKNATPENEEETKSSLAEADKNVNLLSIAIETYIAELEALPVSEVVPD
jgi:hypothetical protein